MANLINDIKNNIDWKSLIFGAALTAFIIIVASGGGRDWLYAFAAIGLLYVGYKSNNIVQGTVLGAVASLPIVYLAFNGGFGDASGFFATSLGIISIVIIILLVGALIGFVGAWGKRDRITAKAEYEKQQNVENKKSTTKNLPKK